MTLEEWSERYRTRDYIQSEPAKLVIDHASALAPGRALDLACGAGRNAMWLARNGWDVVALDGASEAIRIAHEREPRIDARLFDLERGAPLPFDDALFDLVLILCYLNRPLFREAARVLKPGGVLIAAARMRGINPDYCVAPGELRATFAAWELLHDDEGEIAEIVARKPRGVV